MQYAVQFRLNVMTYLSFFFLYNIMQIIHFYLDITYTGQSPAPHNLTILEWAYSLSCLRPIVLEGPNESHLGAAVHTKTRELAL